MKFFFTKRQKLKQPPVYTQAELVLAVLQFRGSVTTDVLEDLGIKSPSSVIHRLKKSGYCIQTRLIWKKTARYSWIMRQAQYRLVTSRKPTIKTKLCVNNSMEGM